MNPLPFATLPLAFALVLAPGRAGSQVIENKPQPVAPVHVSPTDGAGDHLSAEARNRVDNIAFDMIDAHRDGQDLAAIRLWYAEDTFRDNDERTYCWSLLKAESKLRSAIKANNPNPATKEAA